MVSCASTEAYAQPREAHFSLESFEAALDASDPTISPAMVYAYAALQEGVPYANGSPSLAVDIPALTELDRKSTRLNSSHANISYAVFCLKKKHSYPQVTNITIIPLPLYELLSCIPGFFF